jgi:hypothetical protein
LTHRKQQAPCDKLWQAGKSGYYRTFAKLLELIINSNLITGIPMRPKNQIIAPKTRRLERTFDEILLLIFVLLLLSYLSLFLLLGTGLRLFLSEPEEDIHLLNREKTQKCKVGFLVNNGKFEATFNGKALSQLVNPSESQSNKGLSENTNLSRDFKVGLKKDLVIMILPLALSEELKKTITIEEGLKVEDKRLVADIKTVQIGKLPIPGFAVTYLMDSFAPHFINFFVQKIGPGPKGEGGSEKFNAPIDLKKFKLSKVIMPPALLLLFGPNDLMKPALKENSAKKQTLGNIPTLEVSSVKIEEDKITIKGNLKGPEQFNIPENFNPFEM